MKILLGADDAEGFAEGLVAGAAGFDLLGFRRRDQPPAGSGDPAYNVQRLGPREFLLDQLANFRGDLWLVQAGDDFVQETGDQQLLRDVFRDAAREKVEELLFVELAGGGAVAALHVVG